MFANSTECKRKHKCGKLCKLLSSMRLYNSVSCTPVGTARRCDVSKWTRPQSFLPDPTTTTVQRHPSPQPPHDRLPKIVAGAASLNILDIQENKSQTSPQSKNSDGTETTKATAPVGGSFDSFHFDINVLKNQSSASTSYSDPSLYAMSSSSTWTSSTSLFRGTYEPFEEGLHQRKEYVELHKLATSHSSWCDPPPALVVTPILESSRILEPKDVRKFIACGFRKALHRRKDLKSCSPPLSRRTEVTRNTSQLTTSGTNVKRKFVNGVPPQTCSRPSSFRRGSFLKPISRLSSCSAPRVCSHGEERKVTHIQQEQILSTCRCQDRSLYNYNTWSSFPSFETDDDASDFLENFDDWVDKTRSSPFTPIEKPPPSQPTEVFAPLPLTPVGLSSGASSNIASEKSYASSSQLFGQSDPKNHNYLNVPQIGGKPLFYDLKSSSPIRQICQRKSTALPRNSSEVTRVRLRQTKSSPLPRAPSNNTETTTVDRKCRDNVDKYMAGAGGPMLREDLDAAVQNHTGRLYESNFRPIRHCEDQHGDTIWGMLEKDMDSTIRNVEFNEREFFSVFRADELAGMLHGSLSMAKGEDLSSVIDQNRANEGGQFLKTVNMSFEAIALAIQNMDANSMNPDQMTGILPYIPTSDEKRDLLAFLETSSAPPKTQCEKFMVAMLDVNDAERKLEAMIFMKIFADCMESILKDAVAVRTVSAALIRSARFRKILGIILSLGNRLNVVGTDVQDTAKAFKVESLLELDETTIPGGEITVLQWIARVVFKCYPNLVHFIEDMPLLHNAEELNWESTLTEFEEFEVQLYDLRWLALGHRGYTRDDEESCLTIPEEIEKLRASTIGIFTLSACVRMATVADEIEQAQSALSALARYFGEEEWEHRPHELLRVVSSFCKRFDTALREQCSKDAVNKVK